MFCFAKSSGVFNAILDVNVCGHCLVRTILGDFILSGITGEYAPTQGCGNRRRLIRGLCFSIGRKKAQDFVVEVEYVDFKERIVLSSVFKNSDGILRDVSLDFKNLEGMLRSRCFSRRPVLSLSVTKGVKLLGIANEFKSEASNVDLRFLIE